MRAFESIFGIAAFLLFYAYAGYPLLLLLLARIRSRPVRREDRLPDVTVIVPVYNQPDLIREKIENLLRLDYPEEKVRIVISSDGSTDGTDDVVRSFTSERVRLIRSDERRGKVAAQNRALGEIRGEIAIFTDASIVMNRESLAAIVRPFADPEVGAVSSEDEVPGGGEGLYVRYEMLLRRLEEKVRTLVGVSGSFYAVRSSLVEKTDPRYTRDFLVPLNIIGRGYRIVSDERARGRFLPAPSSRSEFQRKARTVLRGMDVLFYRMRLLNPVRFPFVSWALISHKIARWLVPWEMIALFASNLFLLDGAFYSVLFVLQIALYGSGALAFLFPSYGRTLPGKAALFFLVTNAAILVAWLRYGAGERAVVWEPTKR